VEKNIYTKDSMNALLAKAQASMQSVSSQVKPGSKEGEKTPT
jgi:hypothetical protein